MTQLSPDGRLPKQFFGVPKKSGKSRLAALHMLMMTLLRNKLEKDEDNDAA